MDREHPFVKAVAQAGRQRCRWRPGQTLLVAVSGGADSVALLRALHELSSRRSWGHALVVCHVQHHLRPVEAEQDAAFVADLARGLDLRLIRHDLDPAQAGQGNVEAWARRARYAALASAAREAGASAVLTAHHGDDLLETMLMRLMRGSSPDGLAGMAWRRRLTRGSDILLGRPMLGLTHQQAMDYLSHLGQPWRVDHTNADTTRLRAALRHQVTPVLRLLAPQVTRHALALAQQHRRMRQAMRQSVKSAMQWVDVDASAAMRVDRGKARAWPMAVAAQVLRRGLLRAGVPRDALGHRQIESLTSAVRDRHGHRRLFEYAGGVTATLDRTHVVIRPGHPGHAHHSAR